MQIVLQAEVRAEKTAIQNAGQRVDKEKEEGAQGRNDQQKLSKSGSVPDVVSLYVD